MSASFDWLNLRLDLVAACSCAVHVDTRTSRCSESSIPRLFGLLARVQSPRELRCNTRWLHVMRFGVLECPDIRKVPFTDVLGLLTEKFARR